MIKHLFILLSLLACAAHAQEPSRTAWIVNASEPSNNQLARVRPEVYKVTVSERYVELRSAGLSLYYLGPFQTPTAPSNAPHQFRFRLPRNPTLAAGAHDSVRPDAVGVFVNGLPIYNRAEASSYLGQGLWHFDAIAQSDDGTWTATGRPRNEQHGFSLGLIEKLIADGSRHSPIIGYAFDGYPIYGPWGWGESNNLKRMRSGYRLRRIKERTRWPGGTMLTPGQYGPPVDGQFPLGTFIEDYEFAPEAGDLDHFNGRFARTPEYPNGTYAYFLTTDTVGRLAFPYLLASHYRGRIEEAELSAAMRDGEETAVGATRTAEFDSHVGLTLRTDTRLVVGQSVRLSFQAQDQCGRAIHSLEYVHERPLHVIVVSEDLAEFDHIHPQLVAGDRYEVAHTFRRGGRYRLYADFTPPGAGRVVAQFALKIEEKPQRGVEERGAEKRKSATSSSAAPCVSCGLLTPPNSVVSEQGLRVALTSDKLLRAGQDELLKFSIADARTGQPMSDLQPYLGVAAHFIVLSENLQEFIHAHPLEPNTTSISAVFHEHRPITTVAPEISAAINFPCPGRYKLWAQFQRDGQVITVPFLLQVAEREPVTARPEVVVPSDAIRIRVTAGGYEPARVTVQAGQPIKLAFTRAAAATCGGAVVFPALGLRHELPVGETVVVEFAPQRTGALSFTCGMGMLKGAVVVDN